MSKKTRRIFAPYIALILVAGGIYLASVFFGSKVNNLSYSKFVSNLKKNNVETVVTSANTDGGTIDITGKLKGYAKNESFYVVAPLSDETYKTINEYQVKNKFKVTAKNDPTSGIIFKFVINVLPYLLIGGLILWFLNKQLSANNKSMDFGKSRAKLQSDKNKVTRRKRRITRINRFLKES